MSSIDDLEERLLDGLGRRREPTTIASYRQFLRRFCIATGKTEWTRRDMLKYFDKLIDEKYSADSIKAYFYTLKAIHKVLAIPFELTEDDMPRGQAKAQNRPIASLADLSSMITYVKQHGEPLEKLFIATSTVYGLRRVEMMRLTDKSFDLYSDGLGDEYMGMLVNTAKHGMPRLHYIPSFLQDYIEPGIEDLPMPLSTLSLLWNRLNEKVGRVSRNGEGWHSIRRSLVITLVRSGWPELDVQQFMRWSTSRSIVARYNTPEDTVEADQRIFSKHALLEMWK